MPLNALQDVFAVGKDFIPHIEYGALEYVVRNYVMPSRVKVLNDMTGFNIRKISEYLAPRKAQTLAEDTDIPDTVLVRARRAENEIFEVGDRYRISDRRIQTDLEDIVADTIQALGKAIGDRVEADLYEAAYTGFRGGVLGSASSDYSLELPVAAMFEMQKWAGAGRNLGTLHHIIHPFQAKEIMTTLMDFNAGVALEYRNQAVRSWTVPNFTNGEIVIGDTLPRRIVNRLRIDATAGTFRLSVAGKTTAAITFSTTAATTATNVKTALDNLGIGTWTVAAGGTGNADIVVTPPTTLWVGPDEELSVAVNTSDPSLRGQKSAYDLLTGGTGLYGKDQYGENYGIIVQEKSASARSLFFYDDAILWDVRQRVTAHFDTVHQGRTAEYSAYMKYGADAWMADFGLFIEAKADSAFVVPSV